MRKLTVLALRMVLVIALAGSLFVQTVILPLLWAGLDEASEWSRGSLVVIMGLGIVTMQVIAVCVWRLLTLVQRDTVFSHAAFRYVDIVIGAIVGASLLTFSLAIFLSQSNDLAPGMAGLICVPALLIAGGALLVLVLRMLLAQAVARDAEAQHLQAELNEVI